MTYKTQLRLSGSRSKTLGQHSTIHQSNQTVSRVGCSAGWLGGLVAVLALAMGCSSTDTTMMPTPTPTPDMAMPMYSYTPATINQIDTDPGNGPFGNGVRVVLDRVVTVTKVDKYVNSANQQCRYQIWVQDANCKTPPCGLVVKAIGPTAPSATSTGKDCPSASVSGTLLNAVGKGDNVRVKGRLIVEVDNNPPMTVVEHQLFVESLEILSADLTVNPLVISDQAVLGQFVSHKGVTWNKYEGMSVTLQPTVGNLTVSAINGGGFQTTPGLTDWGNTFDSDYYPAGATTFPMQGATYRSISGVVATRHGGEIMPVRNKDFVP